MARLKQGFMVLSLVLWSPVFAWTDDAPVDASHPANRTAASKEILAGHSYHGDTFDEGPRQAARRMAGTGNVHFPVTSKHADVQFWINQGVGQLHGFWYFEAERSFRQAAALDPDCAIAYWGMALANVNNQKRAKGFVEQAVQKKATGSGREQRYIEALQKWAEAEPKGDDKKKKERASDYTKALEKICLEYPDDLEAKAFLTLQLWQGRADVPISSHLAVSALMDEILAVNPYHPVHHFKIHLWDYEKAEKALASAARCGQSAPAIAHMWHMPGHIYSKLKRYDDAIWQQEASARVDHAYMMRDQILPDQIHNFAHNNEWLVRNLQFQGRVEAAIQLSKNSLDLPRHPKYNKLPGKGSAHYGRLRLFDTYSQFELWDRLIADAQTRSLEPTEDEAEQVKHLRFLGRAYFCSDKLAEGRDILALLTDRAKRLRQEQQILIDQAEVKAKSAGKTEKDVEDAKKGAGRPFDERIRRVDRAVDELTGHNLLATKDAKGALERFKKATGLDEGFLAKVEVAAGDEKAAETRLRKWVKNHEKETLPLAALTEFLWQSGQRDEAQKTLEELRGLATGLDLNAPPFRRLTPIAMELGYSNLWTVAAVAAQDVGQRPELETLGPVVWTPPTALPWSLPDAENQPHQLSDYHGKPVLVIFYLGYGCLHCVEQLTKLAPQTAAFREAGVEILAISTDSVANLQKSHARYQEGKFPFPIVSDESLATFKAYRCFDDFERQPLHGAFLIDGQGQLRWWDISYEPFMEVDFIRQEALRLLHPEKVTPISWPAPMDDSHPVDAQQPLNAPAPNTPVPAKTESVAAGA